MRAYQSGDFESFELLYERHKGRVFGFLIKKLRSRSEAEDVFQGTFLKLHTARRHYDPSFKFTPWLFTVCQSVLKDHFRKKKRVLEDGDNKVLSEAAAIEIQGSPELSLDSLDGNQQVALKMRFSEDASFDEIAKRLETSSVNARQIVSRAIKKLRKQSQEDL